MAKRIQVVVVAVVVDTEMLTLFASEVLFLAIITVPRCPYCHSLSLSYMRSHTVVTEHKIIFIFPVANVCKTTMSSLDWSIE